jgi:hypothetical protein
MDLSDTIRLCNLNLKGAETHLTYAICNVEKFSGRFINPRSALKRETNKVEGMKEREGMEDGGEGMIGEGD